MSDAFVEKDGLVIIEAESADTLPGDWENAETYSTSESSQVSNPDDATGNNFIVWQGNQFLNRPGNGVITYHIQINNPGLYELDWHNQVGLGTSTRDHNDTWVKIEADAFYAVKNNGSVVRPRGTNPENDFPDGAGFPNGSSADGWFKVYSSGANNWRWSARTSDNDAHTVVARFDEPGTYKLHLSARSSSHIIDRIVLVNTELFDGEYRDLTLPESNRVSADDTPDPDPLPDPNADPIARDDMFLSDVTIEKLGGNVLANNGSGADSDPDGDPLTVTAVNGLAANLSTQIPLPSGARVTVEADGSFDVFYDPAFNGLAATDSVQDSFTYTVSDGQGGTDTATVSFTVDGLSPGGLLGTSSADTLLGDAGRDTVAGLSSRDLIETFGARDLVFGGRGRDTILGGDGSDTLNGGSGRDSLDGGADNDTINGDSGNDTIVISNGLGRDSIDGGTGKDVLQASRGDLVMGLSALVNVETVDAMGNANVRIAGTRGSDLLDFSGMTLIGISTIAGLSGTDTIIGSGGGDVLSGDGGSDSLEGGGGNDTLEGANANDTILGGNGNDAIVYTGSNTGLDSVDGGAGTDSILALSNNTVIGLTSVERVEIVSANGFSNVRIRGDQGSTLLDFSGVTLTDIQSIDGSGGQDTLIGSAGDDNLLGGVGADVLSGGAGNDTLSGGGGSDRFVIADGFDDDTIVDFNGVQDVLDLSGVGDVAVFDDLDTNGDGQVTQADALATLAAGDLRLAFASASVTLEGQTSLEADDLIL
ncbi:MAG: calcium-binding protein [Alphaproteobacteria bacterium]